MARAHACAAGGRSLPESRDRRCAYHRGSSGNVCRNAPARRNKRFRDAINAYAQISLCAILLGRVSGGEISCPELMYAPKDSGQDSFNDCICIGGAVTRDWEAEACTSFRLEKESGCSQADLEWISLGIQNTPADCMHAVMDDTGSNCVRQDFFLWKDRGDSSCYCPGGSGPGTVDTCSYTTFSIFLMGASTYTIETPASLTSPETGSHLSSCFNSNTSLCEHCPAGFYTNESDSIYNTIACTPCPEGSYSPVVGANSSALCIPCGPGWYSESRGDTNRSKCAPCAAGKYSPLPIAASRSLCIFCPAGHYSEKEGANSSDTCIQVLATAAIWQANSCLF